MKPLKSDQKESLARTYEAMMTIKEAADAAKLKRVIAMFGSDFSLYISLGEIDYSKFLHDILDCSIEQIEKFEADVLRTMKERTITSRAARIEILRAELKELEEA